MEGILLILALAGIIIIIARRTPEVRSELIHEQSNGAEGNGAKLDAFSARDAHTEKSSARKKRFGKGSKKISEKDEDGEVSQPTNPLEQATQLIEKGAYQEAEQLLITAIEGNPSNAKLYSKLGVVYLEQQNFTDAKEAFKTALKYDKNNDLIHNNLGLALFNQGRYVEAIEAYQRSIQLNSIIPHRYINLGLSYASLRQYDKALESYKKALVLDKENKDYKKLIKETKEKIEELQGVV